jgi:hypothetical protein
METTTYNYYITKNGYVACVGADSWSMHYKDEDSDGYVNTPFVRQSAEDLGWQKVSYNELPDWAKDQLENI